MVQRETRRLAQLRQVATPASEIPPTAYHADSLEEMLDDIQDDSVGLEDVEFLLLPSAAFERTCFR